MSLIYEPRGQAREYAPLACNVYRGCEHACCYCYAPSATRRERDDFIRPSPRKGFIAKLRKEAAKRKAKGQVLLSFTCDPYQPIEQQFRITRQTIQILHTHGFTVQILTKGGSWALQDLDLLGPKDAFATTMTLLDKTRSLEWEPNAALPADRVATIRAMHEAGIPTWVSLEPVIDPRDALTIIHETYRFVNLYKVGKLNYSEQLPDHLRRQVSGIDWYRFAKDVVCLLNDVKVPYYVKDSLRSYLPPGLVPDQDPDAFQLHVPEPEPVMVQASLFSTAR